MPHHIPKEIERKYVLTPSEFEHHIGSEGALQGVIEQYYLSTPDEPYELRLRQIENDCYTHAVATLKKGLPPERDEVETTVGWSYFEDWEKQATTGRVAKLRRVIAKTGGHWAVDTFLDRDLILLEAEGKHVEQPNFGTEVTKNPAFTNYQLAIHNFQPSTSSEKSPVTKDQIQMSIIELFHKLQRPVTVGIVGATASGKTTVARSLTAFWGGAAEIISQDDYYRGVTALKQAYGADYKVNFDDPIAIDHKRLARDLTLLKKGQKIQRPNYSMATSDPTGELTEVDPGRTPIILVEGIHALHPEILDEYDLTIFVEAPLTTRIGRRLERDVQEGRSFSPEENLRYLMEVAEPTYAPHARTQKIAAQLLIETS